MLEQISEEIIKRLKHPAWEQRFLAAKRFSPTSGKHDFESLPHVRQTEISKLLIELLNDEQSQVRMQAANALGNIGFREAIDPLINALADPNDWVRVQIVDAIGKLGNPFTAKVLAQHLESEEEPHVRATLVKALGKIGDENIAPLLIVYLEDLDNRVRANCVEALAQLKIGKASLKTAFMKLVDDQSNRVRANVAMALVSMGEDKGREILVSMLSSKNEFMRASAAYAFGEIGQSEDRMEIIKLLGDSSLMVRKNAIKALAKHGVKAIPDLFHALCVTDPMIKLGALEVLGDLKDPSARQPIISLLENESGEVRSKAEEVLDLLDGF